jgi:hypothetical protein
MAHAWMNATYISDEEYKTLIEQRKKQTSTVAQR